jgi:hypothetical protein
MKNLLKRLRDRRARRRKSSNSQIMNTTKEKRKSKGFLGGLLAAGGFGVLVISLNAIGVPVEQQDLASVKDQAGEIYLQVETVQKVVVPAVFGLLAALTGLWGNLRRKTILAWNARDGEKSPLRSFGVTGNFGGILAGIVSVIGVIRSEIPPELIADLAGQVQVLKVQVSDVWKVAVPSVMGIIGTVLGVIGRMNAKEKLHAVTPSISLVGIFVLPTLLLTSCETFPVKLEANQSPDGEARGCVRIIGVGPVDLTVCVNRSKDGSSSPPENRGLLPPISSSK